MQKETELVFALEQIPWIKHATNNFVDSRFWLFTTLSKYRPLHSSENKIHSERDHSVNVWLLLYPEVQFCSIELLTSINRNISLTALSIFTTKLYWCYLWALWTVVLWNMAKGRTSIRLRYDLVKCRSIMSHCPLFKTSKCCPGGLPRCSISVVWCISCTSASGHYPFAPVLEHHSDYQTGTLMEMEV